VKVVVTYDIHLGVVTSEIDRTEEIMAVLKEVAKKAISLKEHDYNTIVVVNGDIFEDNKPSEKLISAFITFINYFFVKGIDVYVVVGNHDSISDKENLSCLGFLKKMKKGYGYVKLIEDIKTLKFDTFDNGNLYLTFLPHITKAHLELCDFKYKTTQEYINKKVDSIMRVVGRGDQHYIFSHLNVSGVMYGSEENLLRKSRVFLPDSVIMDEEPLDGKIKPVIIQGHIHKNQVHKNVNIIGSSIYTDSSDTDSDKYFCVLDISESIGKKDNIQLVKVTSCRRFYDFDLNLMDGKKDPNEELKQILKEIKPNSIIKISPTVSDMNSSFDWDGLRDTIAKTTNSYVKPINPKIILKRVVRNEEQKIGLDPHSALKVWFQSYKHERRKIRYKIAKEYINENSVH